MVNPVAKVVKASFDATKDLGQNIRAKQAASGHRLTGQVLQRLWAGLNLNSSKRACLVDMFPFDGSLVEAVLRIPSQGREAAKMPNQMVVSPIWGQIDCEKGANSRICSFLERAHTNILEELMQNKQFQLDGWKQEQFPDAGPAPTLNASSFKLTCPTAAGSLAVRQDWLDAMAQKLGAPNSPAYFELMKEIKLHNEHYNPAGHNFTEGRGQKRGAADDNSDAAREAKELPAAAGDPETKQELLERAGAAINYLEVPCQGQELLVGSDGSCWVHALVDDIMLPAVPMMETYGRFTVPPEADELLAKGESWQWTMTSGAHPVCGHVLEPQQGGPTPFTANLATIEQFVKHLANGGAHNVQIMCHDACLKFESEGAESSGPAQVTKCHLEISPSRKCVFLTQVCPAGVTEGYPNAGSRLLLHPSNWNFPAGNSKSGHLKIQDSVEYQAKKDFKGVIPLKPNVHLAAAIRMKAGQLRKLC